MPPLDVVVIVRLYLYVCYRKNKERKHNQRQWRQLCVRCARSARWALSVCSVVKKSVARNISELFFCVITIYLITRICYVGIEK